MPRMQLMGRHYHIASDAVTVPAFCMALGRTIWSGVVLGLFMHLQYLLQSCSRPGIVDTFVGLSIALFLITVLVELAIVAVSQRGSIVHTEARDGVGTLAMTDTCLSGLQLVVAAMGLVILSDPTALVMCESVGSQQRVDLIVALIAISQLADVSLKLCCCAMLVGERVGEEDEHPLRNFEYHESLASFSHAEERWRGRCSFLCTCLKYTTCHLFSSSAPDGGGGDMADMEVVARVMADLFHSEGFLDVLPSDIMAGFILLRHVQKAQEHEMVARDEEDGRLLIQEEGNLNAIGNIPRTITTNNTAPTSIEVATTTTTTKPPTFTTPTSPPPTPSSTIRYQTGHYLIKKKGLSPTDPEDRKALEEGTYFEAYALAIYTWMMYTYAKTPCFALPLLTSRRLFRMPPGKRSRSHGEIGAIIGDNSFRGHEAGLLQFLEGKDYELAYATFVNSLYERPYGIFVDHKWQCVVVAIRGTLSLEDLLNDALAEPGPLEEMGKAWGFPGEGEYGHVGMINTADCIAKDLYRHQILHRLLLRGRSDLSPPADAHTPLTRSSKGYALRIVGHSLGAGAAVFLSLMLKKDFPDLRCLAYGTPGGLLSEKLAEYTKPFTTTFVLGRDLVPRLSVDGMRSLRDDILRLLARCRVNKNTVLRSVMEKDSRAAVARLLYPSQEVPPSSFLSHLQAYEEQMRQVQRRMPSVRMIPAGKIMHLIKSHQVPKEGVCGGVRQCYTPLWASPEDFAEVYVSSTMALEHFPDKILVEMLGVCEEWGIDV